MKKAQKVKPVYFHIPTTPVVAVRGTRQTKVRGTSSYISRSISATDVAIQKDSPYSNPTIGAGTATAATAALVIADTGQLPAGVYFVEVTMTNDGVAAAGKHTQIEHRNAANAATLAIKGGCDYDGSVQQVFRRVVVALNERIRVVQSAVVGAASEVAIAHIAAHLLPS